MQRIAKCIGRPCVQKQEHRRFWSLLSRLTYSTTAEDEQEAARAWFSNYNSSKISPQICTVSYSRSSGPGGQKVNKTSSKAMLRVALEDIKPAPPRLILDQLASSRYASDKGRIIVIHADTSRKQVDNKDECFDKLDELITATCSKVIKKEASPEQAKKLEKLQTIANQKRIAAKKLQSAKKASRKGGS